MYCMRGVNARGIDMTTYDLAPHSPTTESPIVSEPRRDWRRRIVCAVLAGVLVLAHGCHGPDEDHELFGGWLTVPIWTPVLSR